MRKNCRPGSLLADRFHLLLAAAAAAAGGDGGVCVVAHRWGPVAVGAAVVAVCGLPVSRFRHGWWT